MLKIQTKFIDYLSQTTGLLENTNIDISSIGFMQKQISKTELIVPVVGGFSAGKSTLINSFLGSEILPTDLTPETALATELRYSPDNYIEAIKDDNSIDLYKIDESEDIKNNAHKYKYLKLFLNNKNLQNIKPLILVDMPGFDSPLSLHNQAILNYLNKGIYFIVLTSIEDGNITKSVIRELSNITEFGKDFTFCLSKVNLKGQSDVENVKEVMHSQLDDYLDIDKPIISLTDNGGENLKNILDSINLEELFESVFIDELKLNNMQNEDSLNTIIATFKASRDESQDAIDTLKENINKIISKKENMIENAKNKYSDRSIDSIINSVARELTTQKDSLVTTAIASSDAFSSEINEIVKHTLIREIKSKIQDVSNDIVDDFSIEIKDISTNLASFNLDDKWIDGVSSSTKDLLLKAQNGLTSIYNNRDKDMKNTDTLYKTITTVLGLTTAVINPLLEIIIVFLPDIISFFTGASQENKKKAEVRNKILSEIIPSIKSKLRSTLPDLFNQQINSIIESISLEFESQLKQKEQEIQIAQKEKEESVQNIKHEIESLENIKGQLKILATQNLYK